MSSEGPVVFECAGDRLTGIFHDGAPESRLGVVIVVGGPQYRVGSHRQFVVIARAIANAGFPVLRFDYRGMGDAEGEPRSFDAVDEDIRAAVDALQARYKHADRVVLLGLCDAASASLIYASLDKRIVGQVLLNPWVRTPQGEAKSYLRHYYFQRLLQKAFWKKVFSGNYSVGRSVKELLGSVREASAITGSTRSGGTQGNAESFLSRMVTGFSQFNGQILLLISGQDLTAQEFTDLAKSDKQWRKLIGRENVTIRRFPLADHTMSTPGSLDEAWREILQWLNGIMERG